MKLSTLLLACIAGLIAVTGAGAGFVWWATRPTFKVYAEPEFPKPAGRTEANIQDLRHLRRLPEFDRTFTSAERAAFDREIDGLIARAASLDHAALSMGVSKAVAIGHNAHTNVRQLDLNVVPIRVGWFDDGLFIVKAAPAHAALAGARIVAIGGVPSEVVKARLRPYLGGEANYVDDLSRNLIESPQALHAAGITPSPAHTTLDLELADGRPLSITLPGAPQSTKPRNGGEGRNARLSPLPSPEAPKGWISPVRGQVPLYLSRPERNYWHSFQDGLLFLQINEHQQQPGDPAEAYFDRVIAESRARRPDAIVVDLRFNPGGNMDMTRRLTRELPRTLNAGGKLYLLVSGSTLSAAIADTAKLKAHAEGRAEIVGAPVGDRLQFWAEDSFIKLPNSKVHVTYSRAWHDWENGCSFLQIRYCYWGNYFGGVAGGDLTPTLPTSYTFAAYAAGRDPAMEAVAADLRRRRR